MACWVSADIILTMFSAWVVYSVQNVYTSVLGTSCAKKKEFYFFAECSSVVFFFQAENYFYQTLGKLQAKRDFFLAMYKYNMQLYNHKKVIF